MRQNYTIKFKFKNIVLLLLLMKIAIYIGSEQLHSDPRLSALVSELETGGCETYVIEQGDTLTEGTDMLLSIGGDGTFLTAALMAQSNSIPVAGVNMGRMGFLSENRPEDVAEALLSGEYTIEKRVMLDAAMDFQPVSASGFVPCALNEISVRRTGAAMLCVDVCVNGVKLPTYWGDGLVISTSSGSTAYSLSVGGPIVLPESKVLIIAPIAPHNLNVRPLVVPDTSVIELSVHSRDGYFEFSADNRTIELPESTCMTVRMAQFSLERVRLNKSNFIQALTDKLYWGEDVRNTR